MDCVIMCAGVGKRLKPLTNRKPKCLINIIDRPIIQWEVSLLNELGIDNIYLITGYRESMIKDYFESKNRNDLNFIHQDYQTGTADAIYFAKDYIDGEFLVLAGDTIFLEEDINRLIKQNNSFLYTKQHERLHEYGTIEFIDKDSNIVKKIWEKETNPVSNFVNCSAYHFDKRIFDYIPKTFIDKRFKERIITNTINLMLEKKIPFHGIYTDYLYEITYPKDIQEVEKKLNGKT